MADTRTKLERCLALAFDDGATEAEAERAMVHAWRLARRDGVTLVPDSHRPAPLLRDRLLMPFGKYKGRTVGDVANRDPGYLAWIYHESDHLRERHGLVHATIGDILRELGVAT